MEIKLWAQAEGSTTMFQFGQISLDETTAMDRVEEALQKISEQLEGELAERVGA